MESNTYNRKEDIEKVFSDVIVKKSSSKRVWRDLTVALISAGLVVISLNVPIKPVALAMTLFIAGAAGVLWSLADAAFRRKQCFFIPTGSPVGAKSLYITGKECAELPEALRCAEGEKTEGGSASNARLDVWLSRDGKFAAVQMFRYRPHEFYATTPPTRIPESETARFINLLSAGGSFGGQRV